MEKLAPWQPLPYKRVYTQPTHWSIPERWYHGPPTGAKSKEYVLGAMNLATRKSKVGTMSVSGTTTLPAALHISKKTTSAHR